ncbi:MAG: hypothetical protein ABIP94_16630, partial [Planctomycetota bacterium]
MARLDFASLDRAPLGWAPPTASWRRISAVLIGLALASIRAQEPAPGGSAWSQQHWQRHGAELLESEDPTGAWRAFRRALVLGADAVACEIGLGRAHLMLGRSSFALCYAEAALGNEPNNQTGMALCIRSLIRARAFDEAVQRAQAFVGRCAPGADLQAARASAMFRVQRIDEAADAYQIVVRLDPQHAEGHLRLGSGLLPPVEVQITPALRAAVAAAAADDSQRAIDSLQSLLAAAPGNPVAHRLLGEQLFAQRAAASMASTDPVYRALSEALPVPDVRRLPVAQFVVGYDTLSPGRRRIVDRTAALFASQLDKLVAVGGSHDLLRELERTTDAPSRRNLRGKRTFDGRVWDDVRGIGGVKAATGIEALDEAAAFGFDTLAHEVAHQVHFFAFSQLQRVRIRSLYQNALAEGRCLDYYAATNEAEYFGQGVEAFVSLCKRPGGETTHGHTRFELWAIDRPLHDFIAGFVDCDPLRLPGTRERVLAAAAAVALRCGR